MDEFEKRLKRDAHAIQAEVSPELQSRIAASVRAVEPIRTVPEKRTPSTGLWWASSLTGIAAVLILVVVVNLNQPDVPPPQVTAIPDQTEPPVPVDQPMISPNLDIRSADFTSPLEQELLNLKADMEKARKNVREDVDFTF